MLIGYHHFNCQYEETHCSTILPADDYYAPCWVLWRMMIQLLHAQDDEILDDWNVHFAATAADLPTCDEDTNGRLYYVEADGQFQVCKTSGWSVIDIQGADGQDGADGAQGPVQEQMAKMVAKMVLMALMVKVQQEQMVKMVLMARPSRTCR